LKNHQFARDGFRVSDVTDVSNDLRAAAPKSQFEIPALLAPFNANPSLFFQFIEIGVL
jgi:hypothetical protein